MAESLCHINWDNVLKLTKMAEEEGGDPMRWAIQLSSYLKSAGVYLPSTDLATLLVSHICWHNNVPTAWKFLEKAMVFHLVPPILVLALLSTSLLNGATSCDIHHTLLYFSRVIPNRRLQPEAFRLYMELLNRHAFTLMSSVKGENDQMIIKSVDNVLQLSEVFGVSTNEPGVLFVEFVLTIVWQLLDASLDDEGLLELASEKHFRWYSEPQNMEIDGHDSYDEKKVSHQERLQSLNTVMAIDLVGQFLQNKVISRLLHLASRNMPTHWRGFTQHIQILVVKSSALRNSKVMTPKILVQLISETLQVMSPQCKTRCMQKFDEVMSYGPLASSAGLCHGTTRSAVWLPLDLVLEDAMDGSQVNATSAIEIVIGSVKAIQAMNGAGWHDSFLGLWMAALRLVQRERDHIEGPVPHLETRLSLLLAITPLVVVNLILEEENGSASDKESSTGKPCKEPGKRLRDLASCLQSLGGYQSLLTPPDSVISAANIAAAKAMMFISGIKAGNAYFDCISMEDLPISCSGNLHHLIVEACITRNLLDTSAYFWPGYVDGVINQISHSVPAQVPSWSSFMKASQLTPSMISALVSSPASSLAALEKIFDIAVQGSDDDKIAAATILCGASLVRGWNIQEHTVYFITRLLSPPVPADYSGMDSHLIHYAPMLNSLLVGITSVDCVQIFSLHGMVPQLAASLMPICEVFGSCVPHISWTLPTGEEISAHAVFSNAFALLLKLWRFNHPPLEYGVGEIPPVGSQLTPEYLLLVRNSNFVSSENMYRDQSKRLLGAHASCTYSKPIFVDSFPKLKVWYRQHLACIASPLSGLVHGTPVHKTVDELLTMIFRQINRGNQPLTSATSGSSASSGPSEDTCLRPQLAAWDILEAVPFVVDAALTACAHGKLSPRELCTGLKDLADFLPASLASIVSYFSAEVSRGVWKPVFMNGVDWPSPAANLSTVEEQIRKILADSGVDVPSLVAGGSSEATLLLPLAAFVSLTITYKLDKASQRFLNLAGPALESLAAGCPWPCMPIVASLWTQKAKRWSDSLIFSASRTVFLHDKDAVVQLLKSCFMATLGLKSTLTSSSGGVGALLGHGFRSHFCGEISPVAPGILYLRAYRSIRDIMFMREEIISVLLQCVRDVVCNGQQGQNLSKLKNAKNGIKYGQVSLATALTKIKIAASLGASLAWFGGLAFIQSVIKETLPSWFISVHRPEHELDAGGAVAMLRGYALAYFTMFCGAFAWGVDSSSSTSKRRPKILGYHMEFLASALDGKTSLGCDPATWRAYVSGFVSLMVGCTPSWVLQVDVNVLKRVSNGLRHWNEKELALSLLGAGGVGAMGAAAQLIIESQL